jgi:glycosyltransferase involved in cell wall biosynthesis
MSRLSCVAETLGDRQTDSAAQPRVLLISADPVGKRMAGLGIRYWELGRALSPYARVTVAHGGTEEGENDGVRTIAYRPHAPAALRPHIARADTIVTHPQWPLLTRWLRGSSARLVIDLYDPESLETLELLGTQSTLMRRALLTTTLDRLHASLLTGHHFMCASEKQRDLWLGAMLALRLVQPAIYDRDPSFRDTIDLVPFGIPEHPPRAGTPDAIRKAITGLSRDSEIVLWSGGIWSWLDPQTAIRAVVALAERRPTVKLVFMGAASDQRAARRSADAARKLARDLGVLDDVVHFHDGWVPYAERDAWLTHADCAISTHADHLETRFAYRTRLLDCLWAGLPIVCTAGDDLADQVARRNLGATVPPADPSALSIALEQVLERGRSTYQHVLHATAAEHTWGQAVAPLLRWIAAPATPHRLADAGGGMALPMGQRLREAAYLTAGRMVLARRQPTSAAAMPESARISQS